MQRLVIPLAALLVLAWGLFAPVSPPTGPILEAGFISPVPAASLASPPATPQASPPPLRAVTWPRSAAS
ncbi:MAG: hypothetical protein M3Q10_11440, partial [Chloroflexota bacterium]|nr:hypothetical protein [Chloroflexota bacterium]